MVSYKFYQGLFHRFPFVLNDHLNAASQLLGKDRYMNNKQTNSETRKGVKIMREGAIRWWFEFSNHFRGMGYKSMQGGDERILASSKAIS